MPRKSKTKEPALTREQLLELFEISSTILGVAFHDLGNHAGLLTASLKSLSEQQLSKLNSNGRETNQSKGFATAAGTDIDEDLQIALRASSALSHTLDLLRPYVANFRRDSLLSRPLDVILTLRELLPKLQIAIDHECSKTLYISYPPNILTGILFQLMGYAARGNHRPKKILVRWSMRAKIFTCELHSNGSRQMNTRAPKLIPLDLLQEDDATALRALSFSNRIIVGSKGALFFSSSNLLGGRLVYFEFPVISFHDGIARK